MTTTTDGLAKNNRDNVSFSSLLIGLSIDFFAGVACARACGVCARLCVRECMRLCVCYYKDVYNKKNH